MPKISLKKTENRPTALLGTVKANIYMVYVHFTRIQIPNPGSNVLRKFSPTKILRYEEKILPYESCPPEGILLLAGSMCLELGWLGSLTLLMDLLTLSVDVYVRLGL